MHTKYTIKVHTLTAYLVTLGAVGSILDSGDPARPGRPAKTGNILDFEPKLRTHHAGWAD